MNRVLSIILMLLCTIEAFAEGNLAQEYLWDNNRRIVANIGLEPNRISFNDEAVVEVIGKLEEYKAVSAKDGQLFLTPLKDSGSIFLSLITHTGKTQDLELKIQNKPIGETVLIRHTFRNDREIPRLLRPEMVDIEKDKLFDLLHKLEEKDLLSMSPVLISDSSISLEKKISDSHYKYIGDMYEAKNVGKGDAYINIEILEQEMSRIYKKKILAIAADKDFIAKGTKFKIWVVVYE